MVCFIDKIAFVLLADAKPAVSEWGGLWGGVYLRRGTVANTMNEGLGQCPQKNLEIKR